VDGDQTLYDHNTLFPKGIAGLLTGDSPNTRNTAMFDNLLINRVEAAVPKPTAVARSQTPIYK